MSAQNREKLTPSPIVQKISALAQPLLFLVERADTSQISKNRMFFASKSADVRIWRTPSRLCPQNVRTGQLPSPWLRTSFMNSS